MFATHSESHIQELQNKQIIFNFICYSQFEWVLALLVGRHLNQKEKQTTQNPQQVRDRTNHQDNKQQENKRQNQPSAFLFNKRNNSNLINFHIAVLYLSF